MSRFNRDRKGLKTSINISLPNSLTPRKFVTDQDVYESVDKSTKSLQSNVQFISNKIAALNNLQEIAQRSAELSKAATQNIRDAIAQIDAGTQSDSRLSFPFAADKDLETFQRKSADAIVNAIPNITDVKKASLTNLTSKILRTKINSFIPVKQPTAKNNSVLEPPELDHVTVEMDKNKGILDCFYSRIVFTLSLDKTVPVNGKRPAIHGVRIMRAVVPLKSDRGVNRLTAIGLDKISSNKRSNRSINNDRLGSLESKLNQEGVDNALSKFTAIDPLRNIRTSTETDDINAVPRFPSSGFVGLQGETKVVDITNNYLGESSNIDKSVLDNPISIRNLQLQGKIIPQVADQAVSVGSKLFYDSKGIGAEQARQIQSELDKQTSLVIDENNKQNFKEIAFIATPVPGDDLGGNFRKIGDGLECVFEDETIIYGKSYRYYVVSVDSNMKESARSRIVEINVDGIRVPEHPKDVIATLNKEFVSLSIAVDDQLVEKFEIYRRDLDIKPAGNFEKVINVVSDKNGLIAVKEKRGMQANGFLQIGEALNLTHRGGAIFQDKDVKPGKKYQYRVYSVDIFGNKSESPKEVNIYIPHSDKSNELGKPSILAEVDVATNKTKLTFYSTDARIVGLFLKRRELTLHHKAYTPPGEPNAYRIGNSIRLFSLKSNECELLRGNEHLWTGFFPNSGTMKHAFIDQTVQFDRIYQYQIHGVDRFGNLTQPEFSRKLFIGRKPLVGAPVNLNGSTVVSSGTLIGVKLNWQDSNIDVSAEDRIGDREVLTNTSVRTLFQVERQKVGESRWVQFPMVEGTEFVDLTAEAAGREVPAYRPEYVERGSKYIYRIQAFQTGAFISNFTEPLEILADLPLLAPINFKLTTPDTKIKPFYTMLNWDTDVNSGIVDHWEIERAEVNNLAADRINFKNPNEVNDLNFKSFRKVYREASRFRSKVTDKIVKPILTKNIIVGEHHFMDSDIRFGNSYFYRIRSVSVDGLKSNWSVKGIKISDQTFEKKYNSLLANVEKTNLTNFKIPSIIKSNVLSTAIETTKSSFSLLPNFSKPSTPLKLSPTTFFFKK